MIGVAGDADADRDGHFRTAHFYEAEGGDTQPDTLGDRECFLPADLGQHYQELFASPAAEIISFTHFLPEHLNHLPDDLIADLVSMKVVDGFKPVDIDHQRRELLAVALAPLQAIFEQRFHVLPGMDAGEAVEPRGGFHFLVQERVFPGRFRPESQRSE